MVDTAPSRKVIYEANDTKTGMTALELSEALSRAAPFSRPKVRVGFRGQVTRVEVSERTPTEKPAT